MRSVIYCSLLLILTASFSAKPVEKCGGKGADIVFVLDSSSSVWSPDFHKQLKFVENVTDELTIGFGPDETRVGVLIFSDNAHVQFYLNKYGNKEMLKRAISYVRRTKGQTNTAAAIRVARRDMFNEANGARSGVKHIAIIITDGRSSDRSATLQEAASARDGGIHIMAIGVGKTVDTIELNSIATLPTSQFVFRVTDYIDLTSIVSKLIEQACEVSTDGPTKTKTSTVQPRITQPLTTITQTTAASQPKTMTKPSAAKPQPTTEIIQPITTATPQPTKTKPQLTTTVMRRTSSTTVLGRSPSSTIAEIAPADAEKATRICGGKPADVFFILDSSTSVWIEDFKAQLSFVKDLIRTFDIGPEKTRVGLSTFSDKVHPMINFDRYDTKEELLSAVDNVTYHRGLTFTGDAIEDMLTRVFVKGVTRPGAAHVAMVITDGISSEQKKTVEQALLAQKAGIYMFAIGVGQNIDESELQAIASNPDHDYVYTVDKYSSLKQIKHILAIKTCEVEVTSSREPDTFRDQTCVCGGSQADVFFILDSSSSILMKDFKKQLSIVKYLISTFDFGPGKTRVGVSSYGGVVNPMIDLDQYIYNTKEELMSAVDEITYQSGLTNTADAIEDMLTRVFIPGKLRPKAAHVAVVITDGNSSEPVKTAEQALLAQQSGIHVIAIGVGRKVNKEELKAIASNPDSEYVHTVNNNGSLEKIKDILAIKTCNAEVTSSREPGTFRDQPCDLKLCGGQADVFFILDSSSSILMKDFKKQLSIVKYLISTFDFGPGKTRVGVSSYGGVVNPMIDLDQYIYNTKEELMSAVDEITYQSGLTNTADAIEDMLTRVFIPGKLRPKAAHVAVVITDGNSSEPMKTAEQALLAQQSGIHMIAIGVGRKVNKEELKAIASNPESEYVHIVNDYRSLEKIKDILAITTCKVSTDSPTKIKTTTAHPSKTKIQPATTTTQHMKTTTQSTTPQSATSVSPTKRTQPTKQHSTTRPQLNKTETQPTVTTALHGSNNEPETTSSRSLSSTTAETDLETTHEATPSPEPDTIGLKTSPLLPAEIPTLRPGNVV